MDKGIEQFVEMGRKTAGHSNTGHGAGKLIDIALELKALVVITERMQFQYLVIKTKCQLIYFKMVS